MDTSIYVALSKELGILRDVDVTANNIANATTTGYQGEDLLFSDFLTSTTPQENKVAFANDVTTFRNTGQGEMQITGNSLDAAIEGPGYFTVQTPLGTRYTRNGNFKIGPDGNLVTSEGFNVLDVGGQPITFDETDRNIQMGDDGTISVDGTERASLKIAQFDNEQLLHRVGNTMYSSDTPPKVPQDYKVVGGMLERSNVQPFKQMTHMMYVSRSISQTNTFITTMYALERKASDTLAKIYS